jgi:hypothetical protein
MNAAAIPVTGITEDPDHLRLIGVNMLQYWGKSVDQFRDWERREILEREPSAKQLEQHRKEALFIIRMTKWLLTWISDPESPIRDHTAEVSGRLRQLEHVFDMIHDSINDAEAQAILKEAFPDEQAVRGAA